MSIHQSLGASASDGKEGEFSYREKMAYQYITVPKELHESYILEIQFSHFYKHRPSVLHF